MVLWEPEQIQTLLPSMAVMVVLTVGLNLLLGKKSFKLRMIPLQVIAVLLLVLEVGKHRAKLFAATTSMCVAMFLSLMPVTVVLTIIFTAKNMA